MNIRLGAVKSIRILRHIKRMRLSLPVLGHVRSVSDEASVHSHIEIALVFLWPKTIIIEQTMPFHIHRNI
jgi:hypothetical protein